MSEDNTDLSQEEWDYLQWKIEGKCLCCGSELDSNNRGHSWMCWYTLKEENWATIHRVWLDKNRAVFRMADHYSSQVAKSTIEVFVSDEAIQEHEEDLRRQKENEIAAEEAKIKQIEHQYKQYKIERDSRSEEIYNIYGERPPWKNGRKYGDY